MNTITTSIQKWGNSVSVALLDPGCLQFSIPEVDGMIGYRTSGHSIVVMGDPVCPIEQREVLVQAFTRYCETHQLNPIYIACSNDFRQWMIDHVICKNAIQVANELIIDPQIDLMTSSLGRKLRNKLSQAKRAGVTIHEYSTIDPILEKKLENVARQWLEKKNKRKIYLAHLDLFGAKEGKRWLYAMKDEEPIGLLLMNELEAKKGWLYNFLISTPDAPNSTTELLAYRGLEILRQENCQYVTLGVVPAESLTNPIGLSKASFWIASRLFSAVKWFFKIDNARVFWSKFHPKEVDVHVLFNAQIINPSMVFNILKALNL